MLMFRTSIPHAAQMRAQRNIWSTDMSVWKNIGNATLPPLAAAPTLSLSAAAAALAVELPCHGLPSGFDPAGGLGLVLQVELRKAIAEVGERLSGRDGGDAAVIEPEAVVQDCDRREAVAANLTDESTSCHASTIRSGRRTPAM